MKLYEVHKVVNEETGEHQPIRIGIGSPPPPAIVSEASVRDVLSKGASMGARPVIEYEDGRVQVGYYVYVPVKGESA
jgi:hypothetical protein